MAGAASSSSASAQTTEPQIPQPTGEAVNDFAGVIDAQTKQRMETMLTNLKRLQNIEFGVVTVKTTGGMDIFDYALAVGRGWGIGPKEGEQQGLLLIVAIEDRKYYTLVSRHLQGELTDSLVGSIQRQYLVPAFRAGDYSGGLIATARAYIDTLAQKRGFSTEGIYPKDDRPISSRPAPQRPRSTGSGLSSCTCLIIIIVIVLLILLSNRGGGGGSGCLNLFLLGSLLNSGSRGSWGSSGWGGGGGFGGSGGGGFGGFGGGGDFDGGGAGGSW